MTQYVKMILDRNHAELNTPVTYNVLTRKTAPTANTLW